MKIPFLAASILAASIVAACATAALGTASPKLAPATSAAGRGSMSFGHDGEARGLLRFTVRGGERPTGSLVYAAEHHHEMFPDIVIELGTIEEASFASRSVTFSGPGVLHEDPVTVKVTAHDRGTPAGAGRPDHFAITCTDAGGIVVFEAHGELFRGDIEVGRGEGATP